MELIHIKPSTRKHKKYMAILRLTGGRLKKVHFGDLRYQHYKDKVGHYKHLNHYDPVRRKRFHQRFGSRAKKKFSASWFSARYLW